MKDKRLDEDLKELAKRPRPDLPPNFNSAVWSKIEGREKRPAASRRGWLTPLLVAFSTPQWTAAAFAVALLIGWGLGRITTRPASAQIETRLSASVTGEVIDVACYFDDGASGPDHATCARMCIASGLPVGLKAKNGKIYVLIGKQEPPRAEPAAKHETLNTQLAPYAAKIVTVTGTVVSKDGMNVIENAELVTEQAQWRDAAKSLASL
jgi:hypothetical protein